jgi:7,8-dihydropterin-6-yl-methyl-4-(beta-D-ribofuranosyl)aminobenzene 5'-phosphate synthase
MSSTRITGILRCWSIKACCPQPPSHRNLNRAADVQFANERVEAVIGGLHLYSRTDQQLDWTADKLKDFKVAKLMGAHCTGIQAVYRIRERLGLPRSSAVVGTVGLTFVLGEGIPTGQLAT